MFEKIFSKKFRYIEFSEQKKIIRKKISENELIEISMLENKEDIAILEYLFLELDSRFKKLDETKLSELNKKNFDILQEQLETEKEKFKTLNNIAEKNKYYLLYEKFRQIYKSFISLITNQSWQSPDFGYSIVQQHGLTQNKIYSFYNDYQRYRANTSNLEKILNDEFENIRGIRKRTYLFNSGMGAFSTILKCLPDFHESIKLAQKDLYFEVISLLKYQKNINFINISNTENLLDFISKNNPKYLFFDIVANSPKLPYFEISKLFDYYKNNKLDNEIFIIIDITLNFNIFKINEYFKDNFPENLNIILFKSMQKLEQYGFDLVSGGCITHYGNFNPDFDSYRQMGVTPTEFEVLNLELLPRKFLKNVYTRYCRNSLVVADFLYSKKTNVLDKVFHPLLLTNKDDENCYIPLFFFTLNEHFNLEDYNFFLKQILNESKKKDLNIILGTSFGFLYSRMMVTTISESNQLCIRFSSGRETLDDILRIIEIFENVILNFWDNLQKAYFNLEVELFRGKNELLDEKIQKVYDEKNLNKENFDSISYLLNDIINSLYKFKEYKPTKEFYNLRIKFYTEKILEITNKPDISVDNEIKKDIIRLISKFY